MLCWCCFQIPFSPLVTIPVASVITVMTKHFIFHIHWISVLTFLYFNLFSVILLSSSSSAKFIKSWLVDIIQMVMTEVNNLKLKKKKQHQCSIFIRSRFFWHKSVQNAGLWPLRMEGCHIRIQSNHRSLTNPGCKSGIIKAYLPPPPFFAITILFQKQEKRE